ncbi:MAG: dihydroorotate dehydrogenase electron transfer subunit, partial [Gracilibacteraceae bacterium]|nr:dihydroorotate dehydrogenase electron transfer subunit [Gracilibacteraceae bacterium]
MEFIEENSPVGDPAQKLYRLVLKGETAVTARPGQFIHIRVTHAPAPLLRRPLSLARIDAEGGRVTVYYRLKGQGTELLAQKRPGEELDILGPLGRGFTIPAAGSLLLVAGGIGVFPLLALGEEAARRGVSCVLLWGAENSAFFAAAAEIAAPIPARRYATLDGSLGHKGLVTDLLNIYPAQPRGGPAQIGGGALPFIPAAPACRAA